MNASTSVLVKSPFTVKVVPLLSVNDLPSLMVNELTMILPLAIVALASMMTCESLAFGSRFAAQLSVFDQRPSLTKMLMFLYTLSDHSILDSGLPSTEMMILSTPLQ